MANHQLLIAGHPSPNTLEFQGNPGFPESSVLPRIVYLCRSQNKQTIALVHRCDPGYGRKGRLPAHGIFHSDLAIYVKLPQATSLAASNEAVKLPAKGQIGSLVEGPGGGRGDKGAEARGWHEGRGLESWRQFEMTAESRNSERSCARGHEGPGTVAAERYLRRRKPLQRN